MVSLLNWMLLQSHCNITNFAIKKSNDVTKDLNFFINLLIKSDAKNKKIFK